MAQHASPGSESTMEEAEDFVRVPKSKYEKATRTILHQHELIKQQELKLKASNNLFVLLQSKDEEAGRARDTESSLRAALRRTETMHQNIISERMKSSLSQTQTSTNKAQRRLEEDSATTSEVSGL